MISKEHLLTSKQVATFITFGFLRFDQFIPEPLNCMALREIAAGLKGAPFGAQFDRVYSETSALGKVFRMPSVAGVIQSLVGPDPLFDHHFLHIRKPNEINSQPLHADSVVDEDDFLTLQIIYFPHDVPLEMGGTLLIPGSHLRRVCGSDIARYQNIVDQLPIVCKAGTIFALYHGIWHAGRPNSTNEPRLMLKVRLKPSSAPACNWNTDDMQDPQIKRILNTRFSWHEGTAVKQELLNRIRLWQKLSFSSGQDPDSFVERAEGTPPVVSVHNEKR